MKPVKLDMVDAASIDTLFILTAFWKSFRGRSCSNAIRSTYSAEKEIAQNAWDRSSTERLLEKRTQDTDAIELAEHSNKVT